MLQKILLYMLFFTVLNHISVAQHLEVKTYFDQEKKLIKEIYNTTRANPEILNGSYQSFFPTGRKETTGYYKNNLATGIWIYYYFNGNPKMKGEMVDNEPSGIWTYYFENGNVSMQGIVQHGERNGEWVFYYENGHKKSKGEFLHGKKAGVWKYYHEDESLKAQAKYVEDRALYHEFYTSGNIKAIGFKREEKSDSLWTYYHENGLKMGEGHFKDGSRVGKWTYFHSNGNKASEGSYDAGIKNGHWKYYDEKGALTSEGTVVDDKKEGYWKLYYTGGALRGEGEFDKGSGRYNEYYESGILKRTGLIEDDVKQGKWLYYYESGELEGEAFFNDGKGFFKGYYPSGAIKMEGAIEDDRRVGTWTLFEPDGEIAGYYNTVYGEPDFQFDDLYTANLGQHTDTIAYEKPAYKFKNRKSRYFQSRLNEFKGFIVAANPLAMPFGDFPITVEYYMQERLGYEVQFTILRSPFFSSGASVRVDEVYERGFSAAFKQKFYQNDKAYGMLYLGHEVRFTDTDYKVKTFNKQSPPYNELLTVQQSGQKYEYSVFLGNRITQDAGDHGFTLDVFVGLGIGYRDFGSKNYDGLTDWMKEKFSEVDKDKVTIPIRAGLTIGYIF